MQDVQREATLLNPVVPARPVRSFSAATSPSPRMALRVSNYRLALGWVLLGLWLAALNALNWDIQWHVVIGRDGFWTPPHWMFYSTVTAGGVICLGVVLLETLLYYRRYPGLSNQSTTACLRFFRGPVGFMLAGFGMLVMVSSAPLDDYWHQIYGIDLDVWTPFHVMLVLGIIMGNLGIVYLFASELNRRKILLKQPDPQGPASYLRSLFSPACLGLVLACVGLVACYWLLMEPTFPTGTLSLFGNRLPSYSLAVAAVPLILVAVVNATGRIGTATLLGLFFLALRFGTEAFMVWGVNNLALEQGLELRRGGANEIQVMSTIYPLYLFAAGAIVDLCYWLTRHWRAATARAWPPLAVAGVASLLGGLALTWLDRPWLVYNALLGKNIFMASRQFKPENLAALPFVAVIAFVAGWAGLAFATSLRYTDR